MRYRTGTAPILALGALLSLSAPALAVVNAPVEGEGKAAQPDAAQVQSLAKAAEKRESEASREIDEMLKKAATAMETPAASPPPGSPPRGARKTIYGDIIIHK